MDPEEEQAKEEHYRDIQAKEEFEQNASAVAAMEAEQQAEIEQNLEIKSKPLFIKRVILDSVNGHYDNCNGDDSCTCNLTLDFQSERKDRAKVARILADFTQLNFGAAKERYPEIVKTILVQAVKAWTNTKDDKEASYIADGLMRGSLTKIATSSQDDVWESWEFLKIEFVWSELLKQAREDEK